MGDWAGFFGAELGAAAALTGLVMVAISINLGRILAEPGLPGRAAETFVAPCGVMVACSFALVPGQPASVLGIELTFCGAAMLAASLISILRARLTMPGAWRYRLARLAMVGISAPPFVVSGLLLCAGSPAALYWLVPGVVASLVMTLLNAWVILVEILR
jgi:modulator of FtsH protease